MFVDDDSAEVRGIFVDDSESGGRLIVLGAAVTSSAPRSPCKKSPTLGFNISATSSKADAGGSLEDTNDAVVLVCLTAGFDAGLNSEVCARSIWFYKAFVKFLLFGFIRQLVYISVYWIPRLFTL